jgi:glycosyl transferase family 25
MRQAFSESGIEAVRVAAVNGATLEFPASDFDEERYRWLHGREPNRFEVGCYLSHLKAMTAFLQTGAEYALICEDDVVVKPGLARVLEAAMGYSRHGNVLRLAGLSNGRGMKVADLGGDHALCVNAGRMKGAGAYVVDRAAAEAFTEGLLPMWLPYDHAFDREWCFSLKCVSVLPFPVSQTERLFRSSIQKDSGPKLSKLRRWLGTYPYQAGNELSRWAFRLTYFAALTARLWAVRARA